MEILCFGGKGPVPYMLIAIYFIVCHTQVDYLSIRMMLEMMHGKIRKETHVPLGNLNLKSLVVPEHD